MDKQKILDNISQFSDEELADFIAHNDVTMEELQETGEFPATRRRKVQALIDGREDRDWEKAKAENTVDAYCNYLELYQDGKYREEARDRINGIKANASLSDEWERVDKNNASELRQFIDAHLNSSFASEAQKMLDKQERQEWDEVDKDDKDSLQRFLEAHPNSSFAPKAKKLISELQKKRILGDTLSNEINSILSDPSRLRPVDDVLELIRRKLASGSIKKQNVLDVIKDDNNILPASAIKVLIDGGEIGYEDLLSADIDAEFVRMLSKERAASVYSKSGTLQKIHRQKTTEVYFWGIPASGKTCALGAIMSAAKSGRVAKSMIMDSKSQAYGYMQRLSSLFERNKAGFLPGRTATSSISEMAFDLIDEKHKEHSVTFIDLAGELVRCMHKFIAKEQPLTDQEAQCLDTLTKILVDNRTINTKIHFFVIEYGGENKNFEGVPQSDYLSSALNYIKDTGIISKDTDAIFLIVTKVDKIKCDKGQLHEKLRTYIKETSTYFGFYNGLEHICQRYEINDGKVPIVPFSLGKVCFQDFCLFDDDAASRVLCTILDYTRGNRTDFWGKLKEIFGS